jgi:uncharacterized membrane protein
MHETMSKGRLEAFSDGVIAILITIMVLELEVPGGTNWGALKPLVPVLLTYVLSFIFLGIYWTNHHHLLQAATRINGTVLWANLHLLFWLSLVPFVTGWMGENHFEALPTAVYGIVLFCCAVAYEILARTLMHQDGDDSKLRRAIGSNTKGNVSLLIYAIAIGIAFQDRRIADALYVLVALIWLIPDRRIEHVLEQRS